MAALHIFFCAVFLFGLWHIISLIIKSIDMYLKDVNEEQFNDKG